MESLAIISTAIAISCILLLIFSSYNSPLLKILPTVYLKSSNLYNKMTQILAENHGTVLFRTSWFTSLDVLVTSDPANVSHVMNSKFSVYQRGSEFKKAFDFLGDDAVFIKDYERWREEKKFTHGFYREEAFQNSIHRLIQKTLEETLIPVLDHHSRVGRVMDLQELFNRYMLDSTCLMATGYDTGALRVEFPKCPLLDAMDDMAEALFWRHVLPEKVWMLQRYFAFGKERRMTEACTTLERILSGFVSKKIEESDGQDFDVLSFYISNDAKMAMEKAYLAANIMSLLFAGRDTSAALLTWFFHLISANPKVKNKILQEIRQVSPSTLNQHIFSNDEDLDKLVYLHATLYETLRLFPTAPVIIRDPIHNDVLPSGHRVGKGTKVILCSYAMGRREDIWGLDLAEFRPERWISSTSGQIQHVSSSNFLAFGSGPWACPGKEFGFTRMKGVVATMLHNYEVRVLEGQEISPSASALLTLKNGLKATISSRWM